MVKRDKRCICKVCGQTFAVTTGTIFYRLRHAPQLVMQVIVLLAKGCSVQAIVKTLERDERTVCDWHRRAGQPCQHIHGHLVESRQHDLEQVQADEIKVIPALADGARETQKDTFRMALAIWIPTRLGQAE